MLRLKIIIVLLIFLLVSGCGTNSKNWKINGIPLNDFNTSPKNYTKLAAGIGTSFVVHYLGHVVYLEANNIEWHQDGFKEIADEPLSDSEKQWFGRAGFVSQLAGGIILKYGPWSNDFKTGYFATGYHIGTAAEIVTYPIRRDSIGDLNLIEEGNGNKNVEYVVYSVSSIWLLK